MVLNEIRKKYQEYVEREWGKNAAEELAKTIEETKILDLMYTTVDNDEREVQVSYDLEKQQMSVKISNEIQSYIYIEKLPLKVFGAELETASFDMYYSYAHQVCEERFSLDLEW